MIYYNSQRRTSIDKFNNRPPFDVKKMDDATCTENKERIDMFCNCKKKYVNSAAKSYINVARYLEHFNDKYQTSPSYHSNKVIPKIIESFQKAAPKSSKKLKCRKKSESLETLFRSKTQNVANHLPDHKLMKDLLKGFKSTSTMKAPISYHQMDMVPSKDVTTVRSVGLKRFSVRVDKETSTTGLHWPVNSNEDKHPRNPFHSISRVEKSKSKSPQKNQSKNDPFASDSSKFGSYLRSRNINSKHSNDSNELEYFPTKEILLSKPDHFSKTPVPTNKFEKDFQKCNYNSKRYNIKKDATYLLQEREPSCKREQRKNEKNLVQMQVEKFNTKLDNRNASNKRRLISNVIRKMPEIQVDKNKQYMSIMSSVRESLPKIERELALDSDNYDWSDNHNNVDMPVRFPKETRNAMETLLLNNHKRIHLSKYINNEDFHIHPAISANFQGEYRKHNKAHSASCHKKNQSPCAKNLLCARGSLLGSCKRPDTVPLQRIVNNKIRPNGKGVR